MPSDDAVPSWFRGFLRRPPTSGTRSTVRHIAEQSAAIQIRISAQGDIFVGGEADQAHSFERHIDELHIGRGGDTSVIGQA